MNIKNDIPMHLRNLSYRNSLLLRVQDLIREKTTLAIYYPQFTAHCIASGYPVSHSTVKREQETWACDDNAKLSKIVQLDFSGLQDLV